MAVDLTQLLDAIRRVYPKSRLRPFGDAELAAIRDKHPGVPGHYLDFLRHIGAGGLGDGNFMIYGGLSEPSAVFDARTASQLEGILFFGDDFSGWMVGFDTRNGWRIVGVDSVSPKPVAEPAKTVADFFSGWMA